MIDKTATWHTQRIERTPAKITVRATPAPKPRESNGKYRVRRRKNKGGILRVMIRKMFERFWRFHA